MILPVYLRYKGACELLYTRQATGEAFKKASEVKSRSFCSLTSPSGRPPIFYHKPEVPEAQLLADYAVRSKIRDVLSFSYVGRIVKRDVT